MDGQVHRRSDPYRRAKARRVGLFGLLGAAVLPVVLFHHLVADIASQFRLDFQYLVAEWSPWVLMAAGLAFAAPVVWSAGRDPYGRWYPRARNAYAAWASVLYLLGMILGVQVAAVAGAL